MLLLGILFLIGIVWAVLYYGAILPTEDAQISLYGAAVYDPTVLPIVMSFALFWTFLMTFGIVLWLWQRSNKRDLQY